MIENKPAVKTTARGAPVRARVLDGAEALLRQGKADFSMRELAAEAQVSFATPFNQFGSKAGIMQALSDRRIDLMEARYRAAPTAPAARTRVATAVAIAAAVMLEEPVVNRTVMGWLGTPMTEPGQVWTRSTALWALALSEGDGRLRPEDGPLAQQLAFAFRGVLSFWTAGELANDALATQADAMAMAIMSGRSA